MKTLRNTRADYDRVHVGQTLYLATHDLYAGSMAVVTNKHQDGPDYFIGIRIINCPHNPSINGRPRCFLIWRFAIPETGFEYTSNAVVNKIRMMEHRFKSRKEVHRAS